MRLSRRVLAGLAGVASLAILGSVIWALNGSKRGQPGGQELFNTDNKTTPDGLASLPKDYIGLPASVPQLGPPLPGDLGRPILNAHAAGPPASGFETTEQRIAQESEAARTSRLFSTTSARERPEIGSLLPASTTAAGGAAASLAADQKPPLDPDSLQNMQDRKTAFLNAPADRRTVSPDRLTPPASTYVVQAGTVIPAALITGIESDLPGLITAQVTENVYDSPTGRFLLVPQGARLIGTYDSQVSFGNRACSSSGPASSFRTETRSCWSASPARTRKATPGSRTASIIIGAPWPWPPGSQRSLASAPKSARPA
jgi:type IV secretion system protein VirB10